MNEYIMLDTDATWHMYFNPPVVTANISKFDGENEWQIVVGPAK